METYMGVRQALNYALKRKKGLLNVYWMLIPVFGWAIYYGYIIQILDEFKAKKMEKLPVIGGLWDTMKVGFGYLIFSFLLAVGSNIISGAFQSVSVLLSLAVSLFLSLMVFVMTGLYLKDRNYRDALDFGLVLGLLKDNIGQMLKLWFKSFVIVIICLIASILIITIPVTFPLMVLSTTALMIDFYVQMYGQIKK